MRMRAQVLLSAISAAVLCGLIGIWFLSSAASRVEDSFLESELRLGDQGLRHQLEIRRASRAATYQLIAHQPQLRASVVSGDRAQLGALAQLARQAGADAVAIVDVASSVLAAEGPLAAGLVATASSQGLGEAATFVVVSGMLMDGYRIPIGADPPVGYLIAANRIDREALRADAEPLGVLVALAVGEVLVTTLPPGVLTQARWRELLTVTASGSPSQLGADYQLRAAPLGNSHLLVAISHARVQTFRNAILRLSAGLVVAVLAVTMVVVMWLLGRVLLPMSKMTRAAEMVGRGQLLRSRNLLDGYSDRPDEFGALARAQLAATNHLAAVAKTSQRLARSLDAGAAAIEDSAATVASGAASQEERLGEVTGTLDPLAKALQQTSQGLQEVQSLVTSLSLSTSATDQAQAVVGTAVRRAEALLNTKEKEGAETRNVRTASVLQQVSAIAQAMTDQRDAFLKVRECVTALRLCIDIALESQIREQHHGQHAHRATAEISRLAKLHATESSTLRSSAEQLRSDIAELQAQLSSLDARNSDDAGRISSDDRARRDRPSLSEVARRSERARSSQSLSGLNRRSTGISSSQSLIPVGGTSGERRSGGGAGSSPSSAPVTTGGGGSGSSLGGASSSSLGGVPPPGGAGTSAGSGVKPVGRSSGNHAKVGHPMPEGSPSGTSMRPVNPSALSGGSAALAGRGSSPASGASLNSSSGTVRPLAKSPHSGPTAVAGRGPAGLSAADPGASTKSLRPITESGELASAQSLNSGTPARRK